MHFLTLVTVEVPKTIENEIQNQEIKQDITNIKKILTEYDDKKDGIFGNVMLKCQLKHLQGLQNTFARNVNDAVDDYLDPFGAETDNPKYIEFYDTTDDLKSEYETWNVTAIKMPNGTIVSERSDEFNDKYVVQDGKVLERCWGQLKTRKSTKRTKRMKVIKDYPINKIYKSFEEFLKAECQDSYNEKQKSYGYFCNCNAYYDWYVIGGRWPKCFLVKDSCMEYSIGTRDSEKEEYEAPEGYKWVVAARKKDIEWKVLANWKLECAKKSFKQLEEWFKNGVTTEDYYKVTEKGVECFGRLEYFKGETLKNYLKRNCMDKNGKYAFEPYAYFKGEEWFESHSSWTTKKDDVYDNAWQKELAEFIDGLSDETVLVCVDCHM